MCEAQAGFVLGRVIWSLHNWGAVNLGLQTGLLLPGRHFPVPAFLWEQSWPVSTQGLIFSQNRFIPVAVLLFVPLALPHICLLLRDSAPRWNCFPESKHAV